MKVTWLQYPFEMIVIFGCAISLLLLCKNVSSDNFINDHSVSSVSWQSELIYPPAICSESMCIDMANLIYVPDKQEGFR